MEIVANPYAATDDGRGVTASSIETWKGTRAMFGRFVEVRLEGRRRLRDGLTGARRRGCRCSRR